MLLSGELLYSVVPGAACLLGWSQEIMDCSSEKHSQQSYR